MTRRILLGVAVVVALLAAAQTALWHWSVGRLEQEFAAWASSRAAAGWVVTHGPSLRGGWPLAARLDVRDLALQGGAPDIPGGLSWRAEDVTLTVALLRPWQLAIALHGRQTLRLGQGPAVPVEAARFVALVPLDPGMPTRSIDLAAVGLAIGTPPLRVATAQLRLEGRPGAQQGEPVLAFHGSAAELVLPPGPTWPLGPRIASVAVDGELTGPLPRTPGLTTRAEFWRDAGGTLELRRVSLGWGPLGLTGSATLTLDEKMQPMGAASARIIGQAETLDMLAANRAIGARVAQAAKAMLGLLARSPEGGGPPEVEVPLTLQDRTLSAGRFPLLRLPPLVWPQPD